MLPALIMSCLSLSFLSHVVLLEAVAEADKLAVPEPEPAPPSAAPVAAPATNVVDPSTLDTQVIDGDSQVPLCCR